MGNDDIYQTLLKNARSLKDAEVADVCGLDSFLAPIEPLPDVIKVASISDLSDFFRIGNDTLVHKAEKDLWRINEDKTGQVVIERLFNPDTKEPIRV